MIYVKINGTEYPATVNGKLVDRDWDNRDSKAITLEMNYTTAMSLFVDDLTWSIVQRDTYPEYDENNQPTGKTVEQVQEFDNSDYCIAGPVTDNRNGTITAKMGRKTELEIEHEVRMDAEMAAKILLGETD